jgi:hypothetical protein
MGNPRIRGKIPHVEWPKIARRVGSGESLAAVAREYECTPPAIRYIVKRMSLKGTDGSRPAERRGEVHPVEVPPQPAESAQAFSSQRRTRAQPPTSGEIWSRVNSDIANFLTAADAFFTADNVQNRTELLDATDRLLRASARARTVLERTFEHKLLKQPEMAPPRRRKVG